MSTVFDTLVWLGAGTATSPQLLHRAKRSILVEARAEACRALQQQFANTNNLDVVQALVSAQTADAQLYCYNLAEYSALSPATSLHQFYPGLKQTEVRQATTQGITEFLVGCSLQGGSNILVIDIADQSLSLLQQLQQADLLRYFSQLHVTSCNTELYQHSPSDIDLQQFLTRQGYTNQQQLNNDPDLRWLQCDRNPLWHELQQKTAETAALASQLNDIQQQLEQATQQCVQQQAELTQKLQQQTAVKAELQQQLEQTKQQLEQATQQSAQQQAELTQKLQQETAVRAELQQQLEQTKQQLEQATQQSAQQQAELTQKLQQETAAKAELQKLLDKSSNDLENTQKLSEHRLDKLAELEKSNRKLNEENQQIQKRQQAIEQEMLKAEAQIEIIKELVLKD